MGELWQLTALELADLIRKEEATSREVLDFVLAKVDRVNGDLNAVVALLPDAADAAERPTGPSPTAASWVPSRPADHRQGEHRRRRVGHDARLSPRSSTPSSRRRAGRRAHPGSRGDPLPPDQPSRLRAPRPHRLVAPRSHPQPVEPGRHRRRFERRRSVGAGERDEPTRPR